MIQYKILINKMHLQILFIILLLNFGNVAICNCSSFGEIPPKNENIKRDIVQWMTINESSQAPEDMLPETKATPGFNFFMGLAAFATLSACMIARNYLKVAR